MNLRGSRSVEAEALQTLRADARAPEADARARVASRLGASLLLVGGEGTASEAIQHAGAGDAAARGLGAEVVQLAAPAITRTLSLTLAAFVAGGAVGAAVHAGVSSPEPEIVYVDRIPSAPLSTASRVNATPVESATNPQAPQRESPPVSRAGELNQRPRLPRGATLPGGPGSGAAKSVSLAEQQALLDKARASFSKGENEAVLDTLEQHAGQYPESLLQEERDALAIKALVGAGRVAEARKRGTLFKRRFPNSLLLPSVSAALERIP